MSQRWEFVDHTADVSLVAYGGDPGEALAAAGRGLFDLMVDPSSARESTGARIEIEIEAEDLVDLLVNWLNELLYVFEVKRLVLARFDVRVTDDGRRLTAACHGEPLDPERHALKLGVKAATRHQASVEPVGGGPAPEWRAQVILDV